MSLGKVLKRTASISYSIQNYFKNQTNTNNTDVHTCFQENICIVPWEPTITEELDQFWKKTHAKRQSYEEQSVQIQSTISQLRNELNQLRESRMEMYDT
ncbi:hypothetical protein, partial [Salmonella sp. s54836]|uniref:hypothetical protein n=1 Tax=Salmonella sp. s54836 TaxID=3159673 RepID=UPI00397FBE47